MSKSEAVSIRRANRDDAVTVAAVARDTFPLACPPETPVSDIEAYMTGHLNAEEFEREIDTTGVAAYLAFDGEVPVGYAVLRADEPPPVAADYRRPAHLRRLYVQESHHGRGIAHALLRKVVHHARTHDYDYIWLGTHEGNARAIAFYTRHKFEAIGTREFQVGETVECDAVLGRPVDQPA